MGSVQAGSVVVRLLSSDGSYTRYTICTAGSTGGQYKWGVQMAVQGGQRREGGTASSTGLSSEGSYTRYTICGEAVQAGSTQAKRGQYGCGCLAQGMQRSPQSSPPQAPPYTMHHRPTHPPTWRLTHPPTLHCVTVTPAEAEHTAAVVLELNAVGEGYIEH